MIENDSVTKQPKSNLGVFAFKLSYGNMYRVFHTVLLFAHGTHDTTTSRGHGTTDQSTTQGGHF